MALFLALPALGEPPAPTGRDTGIALETGAPSEGTPAGPPSVERAPPSPGPRADDADARRARAAALYLEALDAWEDRRWLDADRLASRALVVDPDLAPARLLAGYALLRLRARDEAKVTLEGLSPEIGPSTLPPEAHAAARRALRQGLNPFRRDQASLAFGFTVITGRAYGEPDGHLGIHLGASVPILPGLAGRLDGLATADGGDLDVRGARLTLSVVAPRPLGPGGVHAELSAGPSVWRATGRYWSDGGETYLGARAGVGLDVRFGSVLGLRCDVGASWFPGLNDDLPFLAAPLDVRLAVETWFGR